MVYFCEINKTDQGHASINTALLSMLGNATGTERITCWVSSAHWKEMMPDAGLMSRLDVNETNVLVPITSDKARWVRKLLVECRVLDSIFSRAKREKPKLIFFSSLSPLGNLFCSLLVKWKYPKQRVIITLHGELQLLKSKPAKRVDRLYAFLLKRSFRMTAKSRQFLVLGENIETYLLSKGFVDENTVISVPHPCRMPSPDLLPGPRMDSKKRTVFGHIGVAKRAKNSHLFFQLATYFKPAINSDEAMFVIAGPVLENVKNAANAYVDHSLAGEFMSEEEYRRRCQEMTYAIFMYEDREYELISSGAIMDAISFEIPILALRNTFFEQLFAQCKEPPGKLLDSYDELIAEVGSIIADGGQNENMKNGIRELKEYYSIDNIQNIFSTKLIIGE